MQQERSEPAAGGGQPPSSASLQRMESAVAAVDAVVEDLDGAAPTEPSVMEVGGLKDAVTAAARVAGVHAVEVRVFGRLLDVRPQPTGTGGSTRHLGMLQLDATGAVEVLWERGDTDLLFSHTTARRTDLPAWLRDAVAGWLSSPAGAAAVAPWATARSQQAALDACRRAQRALAEADQVQVQQMIWASTAAGDTQRAHLLQALWSDGFDGSAAELARAVAALGADRTAQGMVDDRG